MTGTRHETKNPHGRTLKTGVLLVNLGTPEAPDTPSVRRYLAEFLSDPRVVEQPRWLWWLILHGIILRIRPARSARAYRKIWTDQGSPLLTGSDELAARLGQRFGEDGPVSVRLAMRYGKPTIADALDAFHELPVDRLLVLPLYPQYSGTTTASVFDAVVDVLKRWRWIPELRMLSSYHDHPAYIEALAASIEAYWAGNERAQHLLFSFHGIPVRYVEAGDPYYCQCQKTARLVAERLNLGEREWSVSFQSRVGREPWLPPYTDETLARLPGEDINTVDVVCPGFAVDCLETLEEIALEGREIFVGAGGKRMGYIPALNASEQGVSLMQELASRQGSGWPGLDPAVAARVAGTPDRARF